MILSVAVECRDLFGSPKRDRRNEMPTMGCAGKVPGEYVRGEDRY